MIKILFMIPNLSHGGAEKVLVNLVNNMDKTRFDITVQTLFDTGVNKRFLKPHIRYKYCMKKQFRGNSKVLCFFSPQTLYKKFIKESYDIAVSYLEGPTARIISGCTDPKTKLVSWIHVEQHSRETASASFKNFKEAKACYHRFDQTICVSEYVKKDFVRIFDFHSSVQVLYNTNETEKILRQAMENQNEIRLDPSCKNLCAMGTIKKSKGFDKLARIHKRLLDEGIQQKVYLLGTGPEQNALEQYVYANHLKNSFIFLGYNTNPYKYLRNSDLFVCSSEAEGFSTAATEALIVGTPVVTTRVSGMEEMLGAENAYGIITDNNENALYEGIKQMLTEPGLLEQYTKKAEERGKFFSCERTTAAAEEMFENLLMG